MQEIRLQCVKAARAAMTGDRRVGSPLWASVTAFDAMAPIIEAAARRAALFEVRARLVELPDHIHAGDVLDALEDIFAEIYTPPAAAPEKPAAKAKRPPDPPPAKMPYGATGFDD